MAHFVRGWVFAAITSVIVLIAALMPPHWPSDQVMIWISGTMAGIALQRWAEPSC